MQAVTLFRITFHFAVSSWLVCLLKATIIGGHHFHNFLATTKHTHFNYLTLQQLILPKNDLSLFYDYSDQSDY